MRRNALLLLMLLILPWLGCAKGQECDRCSSDDDCKQGFVCVNFSPDGGKRCGSGVGVTQCRVLSRARSPRVARPSSGVPGS